MTYSIFFLPSRQQKGISHAGGVAPRALIHLIQGGQRAAGGGRPPSTLSPDRVGPPTLRNASLVKDL